MTTQGDPGMGGSKWNPQTVVIMVLLGVIIVLLAANLLHRPPPPVIAAPAAFDRSSARRDSKDQGGRKEEDPYIANQVKNTIVKRYVDIRDCWNTYVDKKPTVTEGKVMIDWQITPDGDVRGPQVVSTEFLDTDLTECLTDKIKDFKFPPPPSGANEYVAHKFMFKMDTAKKD